MIHQWLGRITPLSLKLILGYHDDILKGKKKWHRRNYFSVKKKKKKTAGSDFGNHFFQWLGVSDSFESHTQVIKRCSDTQNVNTVSESMGTQKLPTGRQGILWSRGKNSWSNPTSSFHRWRNQSQRSDIKAVPSAGITGSQKWGRVAEDA